MTTKPIRVDPTPQTDEQNLFKESFYNWLLKNGVDILTKGSDLSKSSISNPILAEIDMTKLKLGIAQEVKDGYDKGYEQGVKDELSCVEKYPSDHPQLQKIYTQEVKKERQMSKDELKTSEEWYKELGKHYIIHDPDGWDRKNYQYSYYEEKITKQEYQRRVMQSTLLHEAMSGTWTAQ